MKKLIVFMMLFAVVQFLFAKTESESADNRGETDSIRKEAGQKVTRVAEIETALDKVNKEAVKEKDVKWKVCLDNYIGTFKGVSLSASKAGSKIEELIVAGQIEEAKNQLILLRGLAESAEKTLTESQTCERQLTRVDAQSSITKEVNKQITGTNSKDNVNDAMGVGFDDEFVSDKDKGLVAGSDLADAAGVDGNDVNSETPGTSGGETASEMEYTGVVDVPDVVDVSPTK